MVARGQFKVEIRLYPEANGSPQRVDVLVDTGAAYTVLPSLLLEAGRSGLSGSFWPMGAPKSGG